MKIMEAGKYECQRPLIVQTTPGDDAVLELASRWLCIADVERHLDLTPDCAIGLYGPSLGLVERLSAWASNGRLAILRNSPVMVMAFDGSKRELMGEITLPIRIGPTTFDITFQVMDIRLAYSCLLGRRWIHAAGAVPSSLHQKVKFIVDGQLINFIGEKEMMVSTPFPMEYIEEDEEARNLFSST
ncbi:hypothetical protein CR513_43729, partial [Mucuna pruriens]